MRGRELCKKIGQAVEHLHANGVVLANLDAGGILMNNDDVLTAVPRISRINEAVVIGDGEGEMLSGVKGDFRCSAPEVI